MYKSNIEFLFDPSKKSDTNEFGITGFVTRSEISQEFIDECRALRAEVESKPFAPMGIQFRLTGHVADQMHNIGHDYSREPIESTKRLLRQWGLDDLIIDTRTV